MVEGLSDASSHTPSSTGSPRDAMEHADGQLSLMPSVASCRRSPNPTADLHSASGSSSPELMLPDGDPDLEADPSHDHNCTNHLRSILAKSSVNQSLDELPLGTQAGSGFGQDDNEVSELGVTNRLGTVAIGLAKPPDADGEVSQLGVTNRLGAVDMAVAEPHADDEASDLGVTNRIGYADAAGTRAGIWLELPTSPCKANADASCSGATPTVRAASSATSSMSNRQRRKSEPVRPPATTHQEDLQVQVVEAAPTTRIFHSPPCADGLQAAYAKGASQPTVPLFSGRCFLESPLS